MTAPAIVTATVARARALWREARRARRDGWPDVAFAREENAKRLLSLARRQCGGLNHYERRQEARRERLEHRADALGAEAARRFKTATDAVAGIPFGQPILVGHHSEKRHRAALKRCDDNMRKGVEASKESERTRGAAAAVGSAGISSDDPDAVEKLRDKLAALEQKRAEAKQLNAWWRKHKTMVGCPGLSEETAKRLDADIPTRYSWMRQPVPSYSIAYLGAEIRRVKARITAVEGIAARSDRADETEERNGYRVVRAFADNRLRLLFPGKPPEKVRTALKQAGFHWCRSEGAWQRQLNSGAEAALGYLDVLLRGAA